MNKSFIVVIFYNLQVRYFHPWMSLVYTSIFEQTPSCSSSFLLQLRRTRGKEGNKVTSKCTPACWWTAAKIKLNLEAQSPAMETRPVEDELSVVCLRYFQWEAGKAALSNNFFSFIFHFAALLAALLECTLNNRNSSCCSGILWITYPKRKRWYLEFRSSALVCWNHIGACQCNPCI